MDYKTLVMIGMCKNAGKTTALNLLLDQEGLAVTSVGKDGETVDAVTKTPKPQIFVKKGTLVATASSLLSACSVTREILVATAIPSPLGEIVVFKCMDDGFVELAGPSITSQLVALKKIFFGLGAKKVIIDGALSRKSISSAKIANAAVLSTGASYDKNMHTVIDDTAFILDLYSLPISKNSPRKSEDLLESVAKGKNELYTSGALSEGVLKKISSLKQVNQIIITVDDPSKILASRETVSTFIKRGGSLQLLKSVKIAAVTVNPYSAYGWNFDKDAFKKEMQLRTSVPVINAWEEL
ncbi:MAG: hypothetical protein IJD07_03100 [Clostridia bacterium]|nr:hypothetical protein [Clostridia bacterium]